MASTKLKIALMGPYPAQACLVKSRIKPSRRDLKPHPAPWIKTLCEALSVRDDVEVGLFVHSRAVAAVQEGSIGQAKCFFVPKHEPGHLDPVQGDLTARLQLRPLIGQFDPDVLLGFGTESMYGLLATRFHRPSAIFIQGIVEKLPLDAYGIPAWAQPLLRRMERRALHRASGVIAETRFAAEWAQSVSPNLAAAIVPHPVTPEFLLLRPDYSPRIVFVGAMNSNKRPFMVTRAFARIHARHPDAELVLIGSDGDETAPLKQYITDHGMSGCVRITGPLNRECVMEELARSRCLVLASRMDTSPNVITEAHAAGLPVVATRVGGIPEMVKEGVDGFLVELDGEEAMAERLSRILDDKDLAQKMGAAGKHKVNRWNESADVAGRYVDFLAELSKNRKLNK